MKWIAKILVLQNFDFALDNVNTKLAFLWPCSILGAKVIETGLFDFNLLVYESSDFDNSLDSVAIHIDFNEYNKWGYASIDNFL